MRISLLKKFFVFPLLCCFLFPRGNTLLASADEKIWDISSVSVAKVNKERKLIAFTFDDAPTKHLDDIIQVFSQFNEENPDCPAFATLFCNSMLFDSFRIQSLRKAHSLGFELGNHTHSHFDLTTLSKEELQTEIDRTDKYLSRLDGKNRHLLRAPFGKADEFVKSNSPAPLIDWTIDTLDWTGKSEEYIFNQVFSKRSNGSIVLMHDGYEHTVSALKTLLPALKEAGYQVVSVSQLAKAHNCVLKCGQVYIRARAK